jgi:GGDEF domain-containing protein
VRLTNEFATGLDHPARPLVAWLLVVVIGALLFIFQLDRVTGEAPVQPFPAGTLSVSVGVACLFFESANGVASSDRIDLATREALFRAADRSLYCAKEQGRDRVSVVTLSTAAIVSPLQAGLR